jgi:hypothetical protein
MLLLPPLLLLLLPQPQQPTIKSEPGDERRLITIRFRPRR